MERFRRAVESGDPEAVVASLADGVVFESPIVFHRYEGKAAVEPILRAVMRVFEEFRYVDELHGTKQTALEFRAKVAGREIHGVDLGQVDAAGLVTHLTVFVRPLTAAHALAEAMRSELTLRGQSASEHRVSAGLLVARDGRMTYVRRLPERKIT